MNSTPFHDLESCRSAAPHLRAVTLTRRDPAGRGGPDARRRRCDLPEQPSGRSTPTGQRPAQLVDRWTPRVWAAPPTFPTGRCSSPRRPPARGARPGVDEENAQLWALPLESAGESADEGAAPSVVATRPGGVDSFRVAQESGLVVLASKTFPSSTNEESERSIRRERVAQNVTATLHDALPVRWWDADLGPDDAAPVRRSPTKRREHRATRPHSAHRSGADGVAVGGVRRQSGRLDRGDRVGRSRAGRVAGGPGPGRRRVGVLDDWCSMTHATSSAHRASAPTAS